MNLDFVFKSPDHLRYEAGKRISGPHNGGAGRVIKVEPDKFMEDNFIVTIFNSDGNHPLWQNNIQMAPKQMRVMENNTNKIVLRGWGNDDMGESFADYALTINFKEKMVFNCILHMYDRNVDIKYLDQTELNDPIDDNINSALIQSNKNGIIVEKKLDGERIEWTYINNQKHGEWKQYFSDGKIKEIGNVQHDQPEGDWKAFYNNGVIRATGQNKDGKQTGLWKFNDENGTLRAQGNYINSQQTGKWTYYDEFGNIEDSEIF